MDYRSHPDHQRESQQGLLGMQGQVARGNPYQTTVEKVHVETPSVKFYSYQGKTSVVLGVLQIITGICAILFWAFAIYFEKKNNKLGYREGIIHVWYAAPGCWCGGLFIFFPAVFAIVSGKRKTRTLIRIHFGVAMFFLCTFALVYLGWSAAALHNATQNPSYLCEGAFRDLRCRTQPGQITMYVFSVLLALAEITWLIWAIVLCSKVVCGRGDEHNTSTLGTSLQCGGMTSLPTTPTGPPVYPDQIQIQSYDKAPPPGAKRW